MIDIRRLQQEFSYSTNFRPFISSIVFPNYKNISSGAELTFDFPLTLLIGKNGTNKSSILHALYGCPDGKSTGEYWFSTHVDPIEENEGKRAAYFYRYTVNVAGEVAEVLKSRIKKPNDPDYWEPSRPVLEYGMQKVTQFEKGEEVPEGRSRTRWNTMKKEVRYLDFRAEISAFDKAFHKDSRQEARAKHKNRLRLHSKQLKEVILSGSKTKVYRTKERVFENYAFTPQQLSIVNTILDSTYQSIAYIEHDFYFSGSYSVYIKKNDVNNNYSEAFAGSGETSVVRLVYALENAPDNALILLDEPETSLHIEAQNRLKDYILEKIKQKHFQVVISTHSPYFASGLPDCAIKILAVDAVTKKINITNEAPATDSSFFLGYRRSDNSKMSVIVEDALAEAVVNRVYNELLEENVKDKLTILFYTGGATQMLKRAAYELYSPFSNECFLFDGDQKKKEDIDNPEDLPPSQNNNLKDILSANFEFCPEFPVDSKNEAQLIESMRLYLKYARERFRYLPFTTPEQFIVEENNAIFNDFGDTLAKDKIVTYVSREIGTSGNVSRDQILTMQRILLKNIPITHSHFQNIKNILEEFARYLPVH